MKRSSVPPRRPEPAWLGALVLCAAGDVLRIGFFADDFHFLDVARRVPLTRLLLGQYGIWPWYRPLSRELLFWGLAHLGPIAAPVAHAVSLVCLFGAAWILWQLAARLVGGRAALVAPALFVTYQFTKFVVAWASGFQDLLAVLLTLAAVLMHARGRPGRALALAALAPFAKETGLVAGLLVVAWAVLCEGERRFRPWMLSYLGVGLAAIAVHVAVRVTWTSGGTSSHIAFSAPELASALASVVGGFASLPMTGEVLPVLLGLAAAVFTLAWIGSEPHAGSAFRVEGAGGRRGRTSRGHGPAEPEASGGSPSTGGSGAGSVEAPRAPKASPAIGAFLALAIALGLAPMVVGNLWAISAAHPYYAFPAVPWIALAAARLLRRAPVAGLRIGLTALVALNVCGLAYRSPDFGQESSWAFRRWDWPEAIRLSEMSERLAGDVRGLFTTRPESLIVLYGSLPTGSLFQTEDGPATRETLRDPTLRAFYLNEIRASRLTSGRFAIATFDAGSSHLRLQPRELRPAVNNSATSLMRGDGLTAYAYASWVDSADVSRLELVYARAGSLLLTEGVGGFGRELALAGLLDSSGSAPRRIAAELAAGDAGLGRAIEGLLRHSHSAAAHAAYAETLLTRKGTVTGAAALRVAATLDPARIRDRLRLGTILAELGEREAARVELIAVASQAREPALAAEAQKALEHLSPVR